MTAGQIDYIRSLVSLQRVAEPDEIAGLVSYLVSAESAYTTGSSLTIDGGSAL